MGSLVERLLKGLREPGERAKGNQARLQETKSSGNGGGGTGGTPSSRLLQD